MSNENNGLQLLKAEIKNFKNIDYKEIEILGKSFFITGSNQQGKSSFLQALMSPLDVSYIPIDPIMQGEEKGYIKLKIGGELEGEEVEYKVEMYFTQEKKRGRLVLFDKEGTQIKDGARGILDGIIGNLGFNIMSFIKLGTTDSGKVSVSGVKEQIKILEDLMDQEDLKKIYALKHEYDKKYSERTDLNKEVKRLETEYTTKKAVFSQEDIDLYSVEKKAEDVTAKIEKANKINGIIDQSNQFIEDYSAKQAKADEAIAEVEAKLEELKTLKQTHIDQKVKVDAYLLKNPKKIDMDLLTKEMNSISDHNVKVKEVANLEVMNADHAKKKAEWETLDARLKTIEKDKKEIFATTKMPVKGLSFDDNVVTYNGLPLSDGNISTSQLIGIGLKIGMALNPNLKVMVIKDGSLLDNKTMSFALDMCEKKGYQLFIETVKHEGGDLEIEFIEK